MGYCQFFVVFIEGSGKEQMAEDGRQTTEDRWQTTEGRRGKAEGKKVRR